MKLWKYSGTLLMATGGLHLLVAVISGWNMWEEIFLDGFADSIGNNLEKHTFSGFLWVGYCSFFGEVRYSITSVKSRSLHPCFWGMLCCWFRLQDV